MSKIKFNSSKINKIPFRVSGSWINNVAKSMKFTATDLMREMVPSTFETATNGVDDFKTAFDTLKDLKNGGMKKISKNFNEIDQIKSFKSTLGNALEDIKTGNLYNKKREDKALGLDFDDFDDDGFDMDLNLDEDEFGQEGEDEFDESPEITASTINAASSEVVAETVAIQTEVLAKSIQGSAEVGVTLGGTQIDTTKNVGIVVGKGLQSINENISLLVHFNNQTMNAYVGASLKYYEDTVSSIGKILESQTSLLNASQAPPSSSSSDKITIEDVMTDGINFRNIGKLLGQNVKDFASSNLLVSTAKMFWDEKDGIAALAANPIGNLMKMGAKSMIPQFLQNSLTELDNSIKNLVPALFMKANRFKDRWDNPILQMFGELFGANVSTKRTFSISNYNNGPTPFDGETKKAIAEIIPTYLRKILAAITDSDELVYDHKVNKFKTFTQAREDVMDEIRRERVSPFSSEIHNMMKNANFIKFPDYASEREFVTKMEDFFINVADSDALLNVEGTSENDPSFFMKMAKKFKLDKILKKKEDNKDTKKSDDEESNTRDRMDLEMLMSSMSYDEQRLAKLMIDNLEKNKKMELFGSGVIRSRANAKKYFENLENDPNRFLLNQIFNDVDLDKDTNTLAKRYSGGATTPDKFGNTTLSYLRNIQDILVRGIRVFTVNGAGSDDTHHLDMYIDKMGKEDVKANATDKDPKIKPSFSSEEQETARANGEFKINDASDLIDVSDKELSDKMKQTSKVNKEKENGGPKKSVIRSMINSMLKGESKNNFNAFADKVGNFFRKPMEILDGITRRIDNTLYDLVFGGPEDTSEGKSLIGSIGDNIKKTFTSIKDWTINNIFDPLKESLFGKDGIISQIKESKFYDSAKKKFSVFADYAFGTKGANGFRENGLFTDTYNSIKDIFKGFAYQFNGKEYKNSKGETVPATDKSVFGEIKHVTKTVSSAIKTKFFGEKDEDGNYKESGKGFVTKSLDALHEGFSNFSTAIFGTKKFDDRKTGKEYLSKFKEKMPKSLAWGAIGTGMGTFSGVGLLGSLFLPAGPFGMGMLAASAGMLSQSEKFKNWMFGEKDANTNERIGGIVKKSTQDFLKKNRIPIVAGAGIGSIKGLIGGAGFLPSLLVGGPIGGAMTGMATAIAMKSKTFNNFLFGKKDPDGNKITDGLVNKFKKSFNFKIGDKDNKFGNIGAGMISGAVLSKVVGQFGLLGGMMTMGGSPLFGALAGAAAGISISSDKWRKAIFGEIDDKTGKRKGGLAKISNWMAINIGRPIANKIEEAKLNVTEWFTLKIGNPILKIVDPLAAELKFLASRVETMFKKVLNTTGNVIKSVFTDYIANPLTAAIKKTFINPMTKFFGSVFRKGTKLLGGAIALPFTGLSMLADGLEGRHQRRGLKMYKQKLDEDFRESRNARKFKNNHEEWRKQVQKRKGIMSDEQWKEYSDKYSNMKKPGRMATFAKKYFDAGARRDARYGENGAYYSENGKRKSKFAEMVEQQKADFAKRRKELEDKKEQEALRAEYAKHYGYDNFSKNGEYKGWIYDNDVRFEKDKDGNIKALRDVPETKLSLTTDVIKDNTDTMVSILSDIRAGVEKNNTPETPDIPDINTPLSDSVNDVGFEPSKGKIVDLDEIRNKKSETSPGINSPLSNGVADTEAQPSSKTKKGKVIDLDEIRNNDTKKDKSINTPLNDKVEDDESEDNPSVFKKVGKLVNLKKFKKNNDTEEDSENKDTKKEKPIKSLISSFNEKGDKSQKPDRNKLKNDIVSLAKREEQRGKLNDKRVDLAEQGNVINQTAKIKMLEKEKAENQYKTEVLDNIKSINKNTAEHGMSWNEIFGKKGLITLGLLAFMPVISKILGWILDKLGITDGAGGGGGGLWDLIEDDDKRTMTDEDGDQILIRNGTARERIFKSLAKPFIKSALKKNGVVRLLGKGAYRAGKAIGKGAKYVGGKIGKGAKYVGNKIVDAGMEGLIKLGDSKPVKFVKDKTTKIVSSLNTGVKNVGDKIVDKGRKTLIKMGNSKPVKFAKATAKITANAGKKVVDIGAKGVNVVNNSKPVKFVKNKVSTGLMTGNKLVGNINTGVGKIVTGIHDTVAQSIESALKSGDKFVNSVKDNIAKSTKKAISGIRNRLPKSLKHNTVDALFATKMTKDFIVDQSGKVVSNASKLSKIVTDKNIRDVYIEKAKDGVKKTSNKVITGIQDNVPELVKNTINTGERYIGLAKDNVVNTTNKIVSSTIDAIPSPIKNTVGTVINTGSEYVGKVTGGVKKTASKVVSTITEAIPHSAKSKVAGALVAGDQYIGRTKSGVKKVAGKITSVVDDIAQSDSFVGYLTDLIKKFFNNSKIIKKIGQSAAAQAAAQICKSISSTLSKSVLARYAGKIGTAITKAVAKGTGSVVSLGIVDAGFAAWDLTTGAFEAANLFMVASDQVDAKMRLISSVVKALFGFSFIGPLIDLAAEIFEEVTGITLKTNIASIIYKLIASQEKADLLNAKQADFKADWEEFTKTPGNANVSLTAYNDHKNRTVFQKLIGDPIAKLTGYDDKSVRKNTGIGPTAKITGANRAASVIGKTTSMMTLGLVKSDKAGKYVNKIFDKILGRNQDISDLPKNLQEIEKYNNIVGATEQERIAAAYNYQNNLFDSLQAAYGVNSWEEIPQEVLVEKGLEQILVGEMPNVISEMFGINGFEEEGVKYVINEDGSVTKHRIEDIPDIGEYTVDKDGKINSKALKDAKKKKSLGGKIKAGIGKTVKNVKEGAIKFGKWAGKTAKNVYKKSHIGGFIDSKTVRKNLNLNDDVALTFQDRLSSSLGNVAEIISGGKIDSSDAAHTINGSIMLITDKASEVWGNIRDGISEWAEGVKKDFKEGCKKVDDYLGNKFGFSDENGNPISLTAGIKKKATEIEENIIKYAKDIRDGAAKWWKEKKEEFGEWYDETTKSIKSGIKEADLRLGAILGFTDEKGNPLSLSEGVNKGLDAAVKEISSWATDVKKLGAKMWKSVHEKVDEGVKKVTDIVKKIPGAIDSFIGTLIFGKDDDGNKQKLTTVINDFFDTAKKTSKKSSEARNNKTGKGGLGTLRAGKGIESIPTVSRNTNYAGKGPENIGVNDKVNNFAYYSQADAQWANKSYSLSNGAKTNNDSMAARACGPTSMAMVISHLKGKNFTPTELADFSTKNGYSVEDGTTWGMFNRASRHYGIESKTFNSKSSSGIRNELKKGRPVILAGRSNESNDPTSPFTKGGHFVVAVGASGDKVLINDPRGKNKSRAYDLTKVAKESGQGWSFANDGTDKKTSPKTKDGIINRAITGAGNLTKNISNKIFKNNITNKTLHNVGAGELPANINPDVFKNTAINYGLGEAPIINNKTNILNRVITGAGNLSRNITNRIFKNTVVNNVGAGEGSENILNNVYKNTTINYGLGEGNTNKLRKTYLGLGPEKTLAEKIVDTARTAIGMWYVWGGSSPSQGGMDCSGLAHMT